MKTRLLALLYVGFIAAIIVAADRGAWRGFFSLVNEIPGGDKFGHMVLMGTLAWLVNSCLGWREGRLCGKGFLLGSAVVLSLVTIEECSQRFFPSRTFDLLDLLADYVGIAAASLLREKKSDPA